MRAKLKKTEEKEKEMAERERAASSAKLTAGANVTIITSETDNADETTSTPVAARHLPPPIQPHQAATASTNVVVPSSP